MTPNHESKKHRKTKNINNTADYHNNNNGHHDQDDNHNGLNEENHNSNSILNAENKTNQADLNEEIKHTSNMMNQTITITFGEQAENHKGMQKIGELADIGFTIEELKKAQAIFTEEGYLCEYVSLTDANPEAEEDADAAILIVRGGVNALLAGLPKTSDDLYQEQSQLDTDKKALMCGRVVNKLARHNLCFDEKAQEPQYEQGKGI